MPRFRQTNEILKLMNKKQNIRNIGIVAHIDHGKTTMIDSLLAEAGLISRSLAGKARVLDYLKEEQERGITIKTANISLLHEEKGTPYLINLIDTPGHVDFTGKVTRALRAIDGAVVVVDAVEEVMVQTETVIRQALAERVKPVLYINKIDRLIKELQLTEKEIQNKLEHIIRDFNNLIEIYGEKGFKNEWKISETEDSVAFGSALHKWGFTVNIAKQKGIKFSDVIDAYKNKNIHQLANTIPLHNAILRTVITHLPNPVEAQSYRVPKIWKGDIDSEIGQAMLQCDPKGPTIMCITQTQIDPNAGLVTTGRLFSGSVHEGSQVYLVDAKKSYRVPQVSVYMGAFREVVDTIDAGNIAALLGLDAARQGETLIDEEHKDGMVLFERIRYVSEPVITIAIEPKHPKDLPKLIEVMHRLAVEDPNLVATINKETGEYLLSGMGELHLEIAVKFLKDYAGGDLELVSSKPLVVYREGIQSEGAVVLAKSPNKHNKFWIKVEPLEEKVVQMIDQDSIFEEMSNKETGAKLRKEASWPTEEARNVWALEEHRNMLIDMTRGVQFLHEAKDMIVSGFRWACSAGPLCEEPLRGVKTKLIDVSLHEDPVHRGPAQIMPTVRRGILGSFLSARPVLLEPVFKIGVSVPIRWVGEASSVLTRRRGRIISSEQKGLLTVITGYVPVSETFGLSAEMRSATSGRAFWQSTFSHWEKLPENIMAEVITAIRKRKGLQLEVPSASTFVNEP